jgi:hypothetical protein
MRMRLRASARYIALAGVIAIAAVACGSNNNAGSSTPSSGTSTTPGTAAGSPHSGGSIVIGAEQWPQCLNPVTDCASASWYLYTIQEFVFPRLGQYSNTTQQQASALTTEVRQPGHHVEPVHGDVAPAAERRVVGRHAHHV